jgi:hypothetical protein
MCGSESFAVAFKNTSERARKSQHCGKPYRKELLFEAGSDRSPGKFGLIVVFRSIETRRPGRLPHASNGSVRGSHATILASAYWELQ